MLEVREQAYNWWAMSEKVTFSVPKIRGRDSSSIMEWYPLRETEISKLKRGLR